MKTSSGAEEAEVFPKARWRAVTGCGGGGAFCKQRLISTAM